MAKSESAPRLGEGKEQAAAESGEEEPHEDQARLDLAAALLIVGRAERDPAAGEVVGINVAAVDGAQLGREHDGVDEGEQHGQDVEGQDEEGEEERRDKGGDDAVQRRYPGPRGHEDGEVYGLGGRARGVDVVDYDIAYEGRDEEGQYNGDGAEKAVENAHFAGVSSFAFFFRGDDSGRRLKLQP